MPTLACLNPPNTHIHISMHSFHSISISTLPLTTHSVCVGSAFMCTQPMHITIQNMAEIRGQTEGVRCKRIADDSGHHQQSNRPGKTWRTRRGWQGKGRGSQGQGEVVKASVFFIFFNVCRCVYVWIIFINLSFAIVLDWLKPLPHHRNPFTYYIFISLPVPCLYHKYILSTHGCTHTIFANAWQITARIKLGGCYDKSASNKAALQKCYDDQKVTLGGDVDENGACSEGSTCVLKKVADLLAKVKLRAPWSQFWVLTLFLLRQKQDTHKSHARHPPLLSLVASLIIIFGVPSVTIYMRFALRVCTLSMLCPRFSEKYCRN